MSNNQRIFYERRKGPDILVKLITWISLINWLIVTAIIAIIAMASPKTETFFDRLMEVRVNKSLNEELAQYAFYLMVVLLLLSIVGLIINSRRHRRKTDRYRVSLVLTGIFSVLGIIIYML